MPDERNVMNLMRLSHLIRVEVAKNRLGLWLNSNAMHERIHPNGWEPEVLRCICEGEWNGPVWDVGASLGRMAYRIARHHSVITFEPNLNSLQFLAHNLVDCDKVLIVPMALTLDGAPMKGSYHPDFMAPFTGPAVATISVKEALAKFDRPGLIKLDIEGGEYELLSSEDLAAFPLLIEWHNEIPTELDHWSMQKVDSTHSLLMPKKTRDGS